MPRPRTPKALARLTGTDTQHPGRFAARSEPAVAPLGEPPEHLTEQQRRAWLRLADEMPWLGRSDRLITEIAARLAVRIETNPVAPISSFGELRLCLSKMGGTPADRSRVASSDDGDEDPADKFFQ